MKFATVSKVLLMGLALLLASSAFAATKASLTLSDPVTVNGITLQAGQYKLQWDGSGPTVEVSVMQGKTVLTKLQARLVDLNSAPRLNAALTKENAAGTAVLTGVQFEGKKFALELNESNNNAEAASAK